MLPAPGYSLLHTTTEQHRGEHLRSAGEDVNVFLKGGFKMLGVVVVTSSARCGEQKSTKNERSLWGDVGTQRVVG